VSNRKAFSEDVIDSAGPGHSDLNLIKVAVQRYRNRSQVTRHGLLQLLLHTKVLKVLWLLIHSVACHIVADARSKMICIMASCSLRDGLEMQLLFESLEHVPLL